MPRTLFYSWQSDLPNRTNRGFIGDCIRRAIGAIQSVETVADGLDIDRDTLNEQGSPDIAATILEKITRCDVFVADVSIVNSEASASDRKTPNPNVLIELGWAAHSRGWERVLCVANIAFGEEQELPFDIRHRRVISYSLAQDEQVKDEARQNLVGQLTARIAEVLSGNLPLLARELRSFFDQIDQGILVAIRQGHRSFTVNVPSAHAPILQRLTADPAFKALASFHSNHNQIWNDARGPCNGYVVSVTDEFVKNAG